jgi:hypothetical protein
MTRPEGAMSSRRDPDWDPELAIQATDGVIRFITTTPELRDEFRQVLQQHLAIARPEMPRLGGDEVFCGHYLLGVVDGPGAFLTLATRPSSATDPTLYTHAALAGEPGLPCPPAGLGRPG